MYNLFYYDITKLSDALFEKELASLPLLRQKEILKKANIDDRKRSLAGDMLAKKYLSKIYGIPPEKLIFAKGEHGKPYVVNIPAHFNISHSGKYTVLAISDRPIGVDIEEIREFSAITARKLFSEDELSYVAGNAPSRRKSLMQQCFFEVWTAKEAFLKYLGTGLSGGMNSLLLEVQNGKLTPKNKEVKLTYDYSIPDAVIAIISDI